MTNSNLLINVDPDDLLNLTRALVDTPSVSNDEKCICDHLEEYIYTIRSDAIIIRFNNTIVVQVNFEKSNDLPVIFAGHIDTVPPAPGGDSSLPSRIDGDLLYGLGTADMKSGVALMLRLLKNIDVKSTFIFYEGEEVEDKYNGLFALSNNNPELLAGKWAVLLEPTDGQLELGCQGVLNAVVTYKGIAAHSARPHLGDNAIHKSVTGLANVDNATKQLKEVEICSMIFKESLQITKISGGRAENVLPDFVSFNINYRFLPTKTNDEAKEYISDLCSTADLIDFIGVSAGAMPAYDHPLVEIAKAKNISVLPKVAWTDVSRFYALGVSALNCGPGLVAMCHRADEHTSIKLLDSTYELLYELINKS